MGNVPSIHIHYNTDGQVCHQLRAFGLSQAVVVCPELLVQRLAERSADGDPVSKLTTHLTIKLLGNIGNWELNGLIQRQIICGKSIMQGGYHP